LHEVKVFTLSFRPRRSMAKNARYFFLFNLNKKHRTRSSKLTVVRVSRSVPDPSQCSDGVREHACASRRPRSARPAVR
jgi:hypothetical protein